MDIVFTIVLWILLVSATVRHVVRTLSFISDAREKALNRRIERFKR